MTQKNSAQDALNSKLKEFFLEQLQDIYWAENKLVKTLPKMADAATSDELKAAFESHLTETEGHVSRVEQVFELLGEKAEAKECPALKGIAEEGEDIIDETEEGTAQRDVGLIFAGQAHGFDVFIRDAYMRERLVGIDLGFHLIERVTGQRSLIASGRGYLFVGGICDEFLKLVAFILG